jgi:hypothetical protein
MLTGSAIHVRHTNRERERVQPREADKDRENNFQGKNGKKYCSMGLIKTKM